MVTHMKTLLCFILIINLNVKCDDHSIKEFAVELDESYDNLDFKDYNFEVVRQVSSLGNVYHLRRRKESQVLPLDDIMNMLKKHPSVRRIEQQIDLEVEQKSDTNMAVIEKKTILFDELTTHSKRVSDSLKEIEMKHNVVLDADYSIHKLGPELFPTDYFDETHQKKSFDTEIIDVEYDLPDDEKYYLKLVQQRRERLKNIHFNDPDAHLLWQYNNYGQFHRMNPGLDMNIYPVYLANYTGEGVVVTVVDDGLDTRHIEIARNYDPAASMDFNNPHTHVASPRGPRDRDVMPPDEGHGTLCGSVIGGVANNYFCAHGIAFNVNLGAIRMLARNMVTDLLEAYALTHNNQYISIYSNSWGPKDTGFLTSPVTYYVSKAFESGVLKGRQGKGSIFLFAAGNGGLNYDHCGADGMVSSPYTFAVTAVNIHGQKPAYTEECTAISITAAVGGYGYDEMFDRNEIDPSLIASEINGKCHKRFMGTSAAVPLVAGCIALLLEANPNASWRDIQHLMFISARIPNPKDTVWQMNSAGFLVSDHYGAGLLDCSTFVNNALKWNSVGPKRSCTAAETYGDEDLRIRRKMRTRLTFETTACQSTEHSIDLLEHVIVHTEIKHHCRGDLTIILTSPTRTRSFLLKNRRWDYNNKTLNFSFLSLMHWGERPRGVWFLDVIDSGLCETNEVVNEGEETGEIYQVTLEFFGTTESDSGLYRNEKLINDYMRDIKMEVPRHSYVLNTRELYDVFNEQRKLFIQITPPDRKKTALNGRI